MLRSLYIRDFVIVDEADIHFDSGFTVFSGETGAGKSILIDALSLALGARGDTGLIRESAVRTDISAVFDTPPALEDWLSSHDLEASDSLMLRRVLDSNSRSRSYINGVPVPLAQLRQLGEHLVDIHGQHAHQSLLKTAGQRDILDAQGQHTTLAREVEQAWLGWQQAAKQLQQAEAGQASRQHEHERLAWQLGILNELDLQPGEWQTINEQHLRLAHAQTLLEGASQALTALDSDDISARQQLAFASQKITQLAEHDKQLASIQEAIESAHIATSEAVSDLNRYLSQIDLDADNLAQAEERLSVIFNTARKLGTEPDQLDALHTSLQEQIAALEHNSNLDLLRNNVQAAENTWKDAATKLSQARHTIAPKLAKDITRSMQTLAMEGGRFDITLTPCEPGPHGLETVEFLVAGHEGVQPRPLGKIASGGELARLSLGLSVVASQATRVPVLIFDEVDAGIGGATAEVVGQLLQQLGLRHQVLCVTHLPQVAACASQHYRVQKTSQKNITVSTIEALDSQGRVDEIARMLGGLKITAATRNHAREMLGL